MDLIFGISFLAIFLYEGLGWRMGWWPTITELSRTRGYLRFLIIMASAAWLAFIVKDIYSVAVK